MGGVRPQEVGGPDVVAAWDFSLNTEGAKLSDTGPHGLHGTVMNMPTRAVTGHNWQGEEIDFKHARTQYGAIHFHDDDLEDRDSEDYERDIDQVGEAAALDVALRRQG